MKPSAILGGALSKLGAIGAVEARSGWWSTPAWPDPADPPFLNLCVRLRTAREPRALLAALLELECEFGRERGAANAPRTLDLDLIDVGGRSLDEDGGDGPRLVLPHPRAHERAFVLLPLWDVAPTWRHPKLGVSIRELVAALPVGAAAGVRRVAIKDVA
jgi:2-amino-4-hydroxy-6-hydroxymethyldihydropteridine diphosphokinase